MRLLSIFLAVGTLAPMPTMLTDCSEEPTSNLVVSNPSWTDENNNNKWEAGEQITITVELSNDSQVDDCAYPGVTLNTDSSMADILNNEYIFFCVLAGDTYSVPFTVEASSDAPRGHVVNFEANATYIGCSGNSCPNSEPLYFSIEIE